MRRGLSTIGDVSQEAFDGAVQLFTRVKKNSKPREKRSCRTTTSTEQSKEEEEVVTKKIQISVMERSQEEKKLVFNFVKKTLEKGPLGLRAEFQSMKRGNDLSKMTVFVENNQKGKNRYKDVGCLDSSRVKLKDFPDGDYIHANFVETPSCKKRFICTQAPLDKTCSDFWAMIVQEKVENILMLCNLTEKGAKKCHEYFVTNDNREMQFEEYKITFVTQKNFKFTCETTAKISETVMDCEFLGQKMRTSHFHWVDWPDRGVPPADMAVIQLLERVKTTKRPIVVHCSAGIGRTGSVVLIQSILESIQVGQEVESCDKLLIQLREQRNNSVQTDHQYLFIHQVMLNYFMENRYLDATAKPHLERFTKDYDKIIIQN